MRCLLCIYPLIIGSRISAPLMLKPISLTSKVSDDQATLGLG